VNQNRGRRVVYVDWADYLAWQTGRLVAVPDAWGERVELGPPLEPGQHMPIIGPTGCAKTTHAVGFLNECRRWVLALDPKGKDRTLSAAGFVRVRELPQRGISSLTAKDQTAWRRIHKDIEEGRPARVVVGGGAHTDKEDEALRKLMREAITYCRHVGGWALYVDEFELLSSQRMMQLGSSIERMLIAARTDGTSVLTAFQAPAWVSRHATRQARKAVVYPQSANMVKSVADEMCWDWRELAAILDELPPFYTATIGRPRHEPAIITKAPELAAPRTRAA
jgi:hypothetical protein